MIEYFALILAIPMGFLLASLTKDEKSIYEKKPYFPIIIPVLLVASIITFFFDKTAFLTLAFLFITTVVWRGY